MGERTGIEWTDHTWSPWEGCTRVSTNESGGGGCDHCYAERMNRWLHKGENWGPGAPRREYSDEHWKKPLRWNAKAEAAGKRATVFPSVCDPFDNEVSNTRRAQFISLMWKTPWLTWLLLTKRIGNVPALLEECTEPGKDWRDTLPQNVRIGATMVNQREWDRDVGKLLALPWPNFVSLEPLLGPIDMRLGGASMPDYASRRPLRQLDWAICGGESGQGARPTHPDWVRSLRDQCDDAGVQFLFKQWGEWGPTTYEATRHAGPAIRPALKGDDIAFTVFGSPGRQFSWPVVKLGKKAAGRVLDGETHDGFPEAGGI